MENFSPGTVLSTRYSSVYSNAVVLSDDGVTTEILTDFGHVISKPTDEVFLWFYISDYWKDYLQLGGGFPDLEERIDKQLKLLKAVKSRLNRNV